jgi:hypothetical protein
MPLLLTPAQPLATTCGLPVSALYVIVNRVAFSRLQRTGEFTMGYYLNDAASLPGSGVAELPVNLPRGFSFTILPDQADALESPKAVCEAYAQHELLTLLPDATIETVD